MPILGIYASSQFVSPPTSYESIATTTVGAGGVANITFSSIPSTYTHLQIRGIARSTTASTGGDWVYAQFNTDTGSNYAFHRVQGNGSTASSNGSISQTIIRIGAAERDNNTAGIYGASVCDILDYTNTNKNTTTRSLVGFDENGGGEIMLYSGLWMNTAAITSIKIFPEQNNFKQYTQFALYGIKGA